MKVLKQGKLPEPINPYKIVCDECKTEFEYELGDIKQEINKNIEIRVFGIGGTCDDYIKRKKFYVECPLCSKKFTIKNEIISRDTLYFSEMWNGGRKDFEERIRWND